MGGFGAAAGAEGAGGGMAAKGAAEAGTEGAASSGGGLWQSILESNRSKEGEAPTIADFLSDREDYVKKLKDSLSSNSLSSSGSKVGIASLNPISAIISALLGVK